MLVGVLLATASASAPDPDLLADTHAEVAGRQRANDPRTRARSGPAWPALPVEFANQLGVLLLNLGLDVAYTASGALLWALHDAPTWQGYGQALVLQGAFLGAFDLSMTLLSARNAARLQPWMGQGTFGLAVPF